jgi:hypothetical protein
MKCHDAYENYVLWMIYLTVDEMSIDKMTVDKMSCSL